MASIVSLRINRVHGPYIDARGAGVHPICYGRERSIGWIKATYDLYRSTAQIGEDLVAAMGKNG
jgi:hypothetical protein